MKKIMQNMKEKPVRSIGKVILLILILIDLYRTFGITYEQQTDSTSTTCPTYMIYYGELNDEIIREARKYDVVILHPNSGNLTRKQVKEIQAGGACVFGYISIGEDLRTNGMTAEEMLADGRFTGDGTGPRVDPRREGSVDFNHISLCGKESPAGSGFASYYLDDNDYDGKPDFNPNFNCAYTNIGDPQWYEVLDQMKIDEIDGIAGIREILTEDYGRGLGCDGVFLDTIDTCAPNIYTHDEDLNRTRFEWTAPGLTSFLEKLEENYPEKYVVQNRGLFFYNYLFPHYEYAPRQYIDFLMFESYMLDSNTTELFFEGYFADNKNIYAPKISAEANRPDGFKVLSLGYAEGPEEFQLKSTLMGKATAGMDILMEDIDQSQNKAGFSHYITDAGLLLVNDFVLEHSEEADILPPVWSSVHNTSETYPRKEPVPRVGIGQTEPVVNGMIVRWDVAVDRSGVTYTLYYQNEPFDFEQDPDLEKAQHIELIPEAGEGYGYMADLDTYPYQATIAGLNGGEKYYFLIRAKDRSATGNEEKNTVVIEAVPLK